MQQLTTDATYAIVYLPMSDDADDYSDLPPEGVEDLTDIDRYGTAFGWEPPDTTKKLRDAARLAHPEIYCDDNLLDVRPANQRMRGNRVRAAAAQLFGDLWKEGELAILFADTGIGKSILAMQIGESVARGQSSPPYEGGVAVPTSFVGTDGVVLSQGNEILPNTSPPQRVLYLDFEMSEQQFNERYSRRSKDGKRYIDKYKFSANMLHGRIEWDGLLPPFFKTLGNFMSHSITRMVEKHKARVLVVDNISYLSTANTSASSALKLMHALKAIKQDYNLSILVLVHTPKRTIARPLTENDLAGSKNLANFADNLFAIGRSPHAPDIRYIKHIKQRNCAAVYDATNVIVCRLEKPHNFPRFTFLNFAPERTHTTQPYDNTNADRQHLVAEVHRLAALGHSQRELARMLGIGKGTVGRYLASPPRASNNLIS